MQSSSFPPCLSMAIAPVVAGNAPVDLADVKIPLLNLLNFVILMAYLFIGVRTVAGNNQGASIQEKGLSGIDRRVLPMLFSFCPDLSKLANVGSRE